ncbi:MAG: Guanylate kinase [candidate division TM6 bacterium GW2011_GWF2_30_66]|jgi:guanylate kinase|nr:MAG: Guanylate kinase [candidate division TM6 bacterium GW2011_GWF2_30_66]
MNGKLFIVSAPSGAGKTSLVESVLDRLKPKCSIDRLVTYTTRDARPGEVNGIDFCFVTETEFEIRLQEGFFIEWSRDYGCYYGSPKTVEVDLLHGNSRILVIDRTGAKQLCEHVLDAVTIWIYTESICVLRDRLLNRGTNSLEQIESRLELARAELEQEFENKFYKYHILNDDFSKTVQNLEEIFVKELKIF